MAKLQLYAVDIQEDAEHEHACVEDKVEEVPDNPDDNEEVQVYEGTTEVTPKIQKVDEEDEPVADFGAMDTEDKPLEEEVVYCTSICAEVQERQMPSEDDAPMQEDDPVMMPCKLKMDRPNLFPTWYKIPSNGIGRTYTELYMSSHVMSVATEWIM
ncbi:hypothetical protein M404DRAFT_32457 [Pisolithus tinctorius Marx 270]|uniref:Uncharacterized protein n=1 Tax=Pisolithus tinctorius Marx 270 TaxID=870435 RepID=A0A0C3NNN2_PISTI|nr:hypothetical protein M404DRAFT_32457 [Pisolithus tinctorius Marx 270]